MDIHSYGGEIEGDEIQVDLKYLKTIIGVVCKLCANKKRSSYKNIL